MKAPCIACLLVLLLIDPARADMEAVDPVMPDAHPPVELGMVSWGRSLAEAQLQSRRSGRPVLILFQEVPGCNTCRKYGSDILSHPLIVEAIETLFVPVAVFNNRGGMDQQTLNTLRCTRKIFARTREQLATAARKVGADAELNVDPIRPDREPKYYLAQTAFRYVPMTPVQAVARSVRNPPPAIRISETSSAAGR